MEVIVATMREVVREVVGELVAETVTREVSKVEAQLTRFRGEVTETVAMLNGNDQALVGFVQERMGSSVAEVVKQAEESWARFIEDEWRRLQDERMERALEQVADEVTPTPVVKKVKPVVDVTVDPEGDQ